LAKSICPDPVRLRGVPQPKVIEKLKFALVSAGEATFVVAWCVFVLAHALEVAPVTTTKDTARPAVAKNLADRVIFESPYSMLPAGDYELSNCRRVRRS
jgi:hypothetical protein